MSLLINEDFCSRSRHAKKILIAYNPQPDARDTIAEYQRVLRTQRICDEFTGFCNPDEQAMLSLICEKLSFVRNQEKNYHRYIVDIGVYAYLRG